MTLMRSLLAALRPARRGAPPTLQEGLEACERGDLTGATRTAASLAGSGRAAEGAWLRAHVARAEGSATAAEAALREACAADPGEAVYRIELAQALGATDRGGEAIALLVPVIEGSTHASAGDALLHFTLAGWHHRGGDHPAARRSLERALALDPELAEARTNLAALCFNDGDTEVARALLAAGNRDLRTGLRRALYLPIAYRSRQEVGDTRGQLRIDLDALDGIDDGVRPHPEIDIGRTPFLLAYQGLDDRADMQHIAGLVRRHYHCNAHSVPRPARAAGTRRRIGFATAYFHHHSVGRALLCLIEALDAREWEVTLFACGAPVDDVYARRFAALAPLVRLPATVREAAAVIEASGQDVLVYPELGMDTFTYYLAFWRLAPLQCALAGHPVTSGIDSIDLFLSDRDAEPPGAGRHYTEGLRALPRFHLPVHGLRHLAPLPVAGGARTYLCTQTLIKLHPDFDDVLADVLAGDPQGQVALYGAPEEALNRIVMTRLAGRLGAAIGRVRLLPRQSFEGYMDTLRRATVVLDTVHFGGGNTTLEALAACVPVVTSPGPFLRGRFAMARLSALGLESCIAADRSGYGALAVSLARDTARRDEVVARLAQAAPTMLDPMAPAHAFAAALRTVAPAARQSA